MMMGPEPMIMIFLMSVRLGMRVSAFVGCVAAAGQVRLSITTVAVA